MNPNKQEILPLTGIRGIAALCVLLAHYVFWVNPIAQASLPPDLVALFSLPYIGMTIFFVLSGFVIAYNYAEMPWQQRPANTTARFMTYRIARLYPLMLFFTAIIVWHHIPNFGWHKLIEDPKALRDLLLQLTMTQSWTPHLDTGGKLVIDGSYFVSWSISSEFFLYVTFAALMLTRIRFRLRLVIGYLVIAAVVLFAWSHQNTGDYFAQLSDTDYNRWLFDVSPYYRALEFGLGMLAYWLYRNVPSMVLQRFGGAVGACILAYTYLGTSWQWLVPSAVHIKLFSAVGVALILQACTQPTRLNRILGWRPLVYLGTISYSVYLFHYMAPSILARHSTNTVFDEKILLLFGFNLAICIGFTLILATGLYYLVEVPGRRLVRKIADRYLVTKQPV